MFVVCERAIKWSKKIFKRLPMSNEWILETIMMENFEGRYVAYKS
jgi:hypothetical protein